MTGALSHLDLCVSDPAHSVPFYDRVLRRLGFRAILLPEQATAVGAWVSRQDGAAAFSIALEPARGEGASRAHDRYSPGLHHLAFHASSRAEVDDFHAFLEAWGARVLDRPTEYDYTPGYYAVFFADPDGLKLERVHEPSPLGSPPAIFWHLGDRCRMLFGAWRNNPCPISRRVHVLSQFVSRPSVRFEGHHPSAVLDGELVACVRTSIWARVRLGHGV